MNTYQFIASLVNSLAWPGTIIFIILFFKKPLTKLILSLVRLKIKDFQAEFRQDIKNLEFIAETANIPTIPKTKEKDSTMQVDITDLSKTSPSSAILVSWIKVQEEMDKTIRELKLSPREASTIRPSDKLHTLAKQPNFSSDILDIINGLRHVRNNVVHADPLANELTEDAVKDYVDLSNRVITYLRSMRKLPSILK